MKHIVTLTGLLNSDEKMDEEMVSNYRVELSTGQYY